MIAVTGYPIGYAVWLSLERYNLELPQDIKFVGFSNYAAVLSSPYWWQALKVTVIITIISVAITLVLGMLLAMVMHRTLFGRGTVRDRRAHPYGIVTCRRRLRLAVRVDAQPGLPVRGVQQQRAADHRSTTAIAVIILAEVWKTTPFMGLLLLAGLSLVPEDLQKAAKVDGATAWQRFTKITLPLMKPAILVALLFRTLDSFRIFDNIFILTGGRQQHRVGLHPRLRQPVQRAEPGDRVGDLDPHLHLRGDHRRLVHQGLRRCGPGHEHGKEVTRSWLL